MSQIFHAFSLLSWSQLSQSIAVSDRASLKPFPCITLNFVELSKFSQYPDLARIVHSQKRHQLKVKYHTFERGFFNSHSTLIFVGILLKKVIKIQKKKRKDPTPQKSDIIPFELLSKINWLRHQKCIMDTICLSYKYIGPICCKNYIHTVTWKQTMALVYFDEGCFRWSCPAKPTCMVVMCQAECENRLQLYSYQALGVTTR